MPFNKERFEVNAGIDGDAAVGVIRRALKAPAFPGHELAPDIESEMKYQDAVVNITRAIDTLPKEERSQVVHRIFNKIKSNRHAAATPSVVAAEKTMEMLEWLRPWESKIVLRRCEGSRAHSLAEAIRDGRTATFQNKDGKIIDKANAEGRLYPCRFEDADDKMIIGQVFVVEHDWGAAFTNAAGMDECGISPPYDRCCFEFNLSGRHLCVLTRKVPDDLKTWDVSAFVAMSGPTLKGWWLHLSAKEHIWRDILRIVVRQVDAICVSLSANVAETEVVRAPYRLNAKRERDGRLPVFDYHIVNLARRHRVGRLPDDHQPGDRRRPRLHFRRGHWRHYENHKVEIAWTLVGDPDLGFIDKEYRL